MTIKLYNSASRRKEDFAPLDKTDVRMYVCGPTVYDRAHLGNARPVIVFDILYRLLRHTYGEEHVSYVRNFTDVDDKINARAAESGRSIGEITAETSQWYLDDMAAVGTLQPSLKGKDHERAMPRATAWIGPMVAMIEDLIAKGYAYEAEGHALFAVESYKEYGALSGRSTDDMIAGARVEVAPYKRNPMDFVLWKPSTEDQPGWDSPWGRGRPGWHIECSAMAYELLGAQFDIHGGGNDLQFPHHENEIAQSKCAGHGFANYWLHNEMLQVEGKKMSKSLGNFFTVRDLLDQGVPGEVIRFVMLGTHYRKPMDWTEAKRVEAESKLDELAVGLKASLEILNDAHAGVPHPEGRFEGLSEGIQQSLANDLDTHGALQVSAVSAHVLRKLRGANAVDGKTKELAQQFLNDLNILGFFESVLKRAANLDLAKRALSDYEEEMTFLYNFAKGTKDFAVFDEKKRLFAGAGVEVRVTKDGVALVAKSDFDPEKVKGLL